MKSCLLGVVYAIVTLSHIGSAWGTTLTYLDFSDSSGLNFNGLTTTTLNDSGQSVLRLTPTTATGTANMKGVAYTTNMIQLGLNGEFHSWFQFQLSDAGGISDEDGQGGDGFTFVLQQKNNWMMGDYGGALGYSRLDSGIQPSIAIEFDTFNNPTLSDISGNHIGVDLNGSVISEVSVDIPDRLNNGDIYNAWIDYSGNNQLLEVRLSNGAIRPTSPLLTYSIILTNLFEIPEAYVGFTSSIGGGVQNHDIISWSLTTTTVPIPAAVWLFGSGLLGLVGIARRKKAALPLR